MNPAANNSVIGTQLLQTLGFPACIRANNAEEPARATHLLDESIILFNTYPLKIISSSNAAKNNIMLTMNTPGLKPTYPEIVIAPNNHKTKNKPPINAKAKPKPINISFALSFTESPIDIRGLRSINFVASHKAKKLPATCEAVRNNMIGESKLISNNA